VVINNAEEGEARSSLLQEFLSSIFERVFGQNQEENTMGSRNLVVSYQQQPRGKKKKSVFGSWFLNFFFLGFVSFCVSVSFFVVRTAICGFYE
jgi:hypothetical protein